MYRYVDLQASLYFVPFWYLYGTRYLVPGTGMWLRIVLTTRGKKLSTCTYVYIHIRVPVYCPWKISYVPVEEVMMALLGVL